MSALEIFSIFCSLLFRSKAAPAIKEEAEPSPSIPKENDETFKPDEPPKEDKGKKTPGLPGEDIKVFPNIKDRVGHFATLAEESTPVVPRRTTPGLARKNPGSGDYLEPQIPLGKERPRIGSGGDTNTMEELKVTMREQRMQRDTVRLVVQIRQSTGY